MHSPVEAAGGSFVHPVLHGLNPFGTVSGVRPAVTDLPGTQVYRGNGGVPECLAAGPVAAGRGSR